MHNFKNSLILGLFAAIITYTYLWYNKNQKVIIIEENLYNETHMLKGELTPSSIKEIELQLTILKNQQISFLYPTIIAILVFSLFYNLNI